MLELFDGDSIYLRGATTGFHLDFTKEKDGGKEKGGFVIVY